VKSITLLLDYDGTLHDWDSVLKHSLEGILDLSGEEFFEKWTYEIHRDIIHDRYLEHHDDNLFHCRLLFKNLDLPFDRDIAEIICRKMDNAKKIARKEPIYFPEALPFLDGVSKLNITLCLSTGTGAKDKAEALKNQFDRDFFDYILSETSIGHLKTEPEYYEGALKITNSNADRTISLGDTPLSDIRPAKMVGINTIWLNRRKESWPRDLEPSDFVVKDLTDSLNIIRNMI
jgi:HAD superfamily hydrolase (TIGR01549 family)